MSLFIPEIHIKEKPIVKHPWERRIKLHHSNTFKYSHNSVENPVYPVPKAKDDLDDNQRIKFIVIGNRVTKEFIYCLNLVKGLHKYRKKLFEAPTIRGVSSVEWPKIWNELKMKFGPEVYNLKSQVAVLINNKFLGGEEELRQLIETTYVYLKPEYLNFFKEGVENFSNFVKSQGRPCAILHIAIDDIPIGPLLFMLYSDIVPLTCQNFVTLCELSKGGYRGTPIHRIVENGWIQCGGFGMKNTRKLNCENYIVPHDRRGVLCMANDGRHNDCSTQFFVLLQPALWMKHKYVAFGQLIEGEQTLKKIENVPTWYESPTARISIYGAGVFNMECQWQPINKSATEYISSHIEDLVELGTLLFEELLEKAYPIIEARELGREHNMVKLYEECPEESDEEYVDQPDKKITSEKGTTKREGKKSNQAPTPISTDTNNQFDVEEYVLEEMSVVADIFPTVTSERVLQKPYYLPLTDIPCPGEVESAFNLQRLLRGDFCYESDLVTSRRERARMYADNNQNNQYLYISKEKFNTLFDCLEPRTSENSLDFDDEREIEAYIRENADSISLAGPVINKIANMQDKYDMFDEMNEGGKKGILCDEDLRLMRVVAKELHTVQSTTVSIMDPLKSHKKIHRRQTGFVRQEQLSELEKMFDHLPETGDDDDTHDSVCTTKWEDRLPGYNKNAKTAKSNREQTTRKILYRRRSTLTRYPTFKDFKPTSEGENKTKYDYLTRSALHFTKCDDNVKLRTPPPNIGYDTIQNTLTLQHGSKLTRKVSSDYPTTLNRFSELEHQSLRTIEYSKIRPSLSIGEYKRKNQKYMDEQLTFSKSKMVNSAFTIPTNKQFRSSVHKFPVKEKTRSTKALKEERKKKKEN